MTSIYPPSQCLENKTSTLGPFQTSLQQHQAIGHVVLLHGSSIGMTHPVMQMFAQQLQALNLRVSMFDFSYMQQVVITGKRRPPARVPQLLLELEQWLNFLRDKQPIWLVGKSLGGRLASMISQEANNQIAGWVAVGYPFHPQGKPEKLRVEHLLHNQCPGLIIQGTRDAMGMLAEVLSYGLPDSVQCQWLEHMDHGLQPYKQAYFTQQQAFAQAATWIQAWILKERGV